MTVHHTAFDDTMTAAQNRMLFALWRQHGIRDRSDRLRITGIMIGREIDSSRELTRHEATRLIDRLSVEGPEDLF
jgi:DNA-binding MarR family transcriptional regulator